MIPYWAGNEDHETYVVGAGSIVTTAGRFPTGLSSALGVGASTAIYWQNTKQFSATTFWFSFWHWATSASMTTNLFELLDAAGVVRLRLTAPTTGTLKLQKLDAAATATDLGSSFATPLAISTLDRIDVFVDYQAAGSISIYVNKILYQTYSGDITTNSITALASWRLKNTTGNNGQAFSGIMVADSDTRSCFLQRLQPVANGNTHNYDTGTPAAANVNEITLSDLTLDGSTTAGQINQYTIPALMVGTWSIRAIVGSARMQRGATGPTKTALGVRVGGTDYWGSDQTLTTSWDSYQEIWSLDPSTSAAWTALPTNIGLKSAA